MCPVLSMVDDLTLVLVELCTEVRLSRFKEVITVVDTVVFIFYI